MKWKSMHFDLSCISLLLLSIISNVLRIPISGHCAAALLLHDDMHDDIWYLMIHMMIHMMIYEIYDLWSFPFQATVRLHSCCMMTCTLNGGPEVGADREGLEARRMPGRQQHQQQMGNQHQQKFPGNKTTNSNGSISCPTLLDNYYVCSYARNLLLDVPC